jgi:hypothetical protein
MNTLDKNLEDWNPSEEFWFYTEMQGKRDDIDFITLTYLPSKLVLQKL